MTLVLALLTVSAQAATLTVDATGGGDYLSIQSAIDAAASDDRLVINSGTYMENISINGKDLTLEGAGSTTVTIWGDGTDVALSITGATVSVGGLAVMNGEGGIEISGGSATLSGLLVSENSGPSNGGGIAALDSATIVLSDSEIKRNSAQRGGGLYVGEGSSMNVSDTTISRNTATSYGGGAYALGNLFFDTSIIDSNTASADGGGVYASGNLVIQATTLEANSAGGSGGGVYATEKIPDLYLCEVFGNSAVNGGGVAIIDASAGGVNFRIRGCDLAYNTASEAGGAIHMSGVGEIYLKEVVLWMNDASTEGGAIYMSDMDAPWVSNVRAWYNSATDGGGIFATDLHGGQTAKSSFGGNWATGTGGGAYYGTPTRLHTILSSRFLENNASSGGGIAIVGDGALRHTIQNIDASGNTGDGIAIIASLQGRVLNSIMLDNTAAGLHVDSDSIGSAIKNNDSVGNGTNWAGAISDLTGTDGNISADPLYTRFAVDGDPISDFLYLQSGSPAINAGRSDLVDPDGSRADMGSYGGASAEYGDSDGDGVGPAGGDCDDGDASVHPGASEIWRNGRDNDCAGDDDFDEDTDGHRYPQDCDDQDPSVHPGAEDIDGDGVDSDCDGSDGEGGGTDSGGSGSDTGSPWQDDTDTGGDPYDDADRDGFSQAEDCNDASAEANPDADEICDDGLDNDCDGLTDDADGDCLTGDNKGCNCAVSSSHTSLWLLALCAGIAVRRRQSP